MSSKGKAVVTGKGKRKLEKNMKTSHRKRKNAGVLKFFDVDAEEVGGSSESEYSMDSFFNDNDVLEEAFDNYINASEIEKQSDLPFLEGMDDMNVEELETMVLERYKPTSSLIIYAEDVHQTKHYFEPNPVIPSLEKSIRSLDDPIIWKVKCTAGRERHSAVCLMQKYVDRQALGTSLKIISAFAVERVKGFLYVEAYKQCDIYEGCKGICSINLRHMTPVPEKEVSRLFSVRNESNVIAVGTWVHVKKGKYKGDLAQVVAVNDLRKRATVKLIPRVDLQAIAEKIVGGVTAKKTAIPPQRLIRLTDLEDFRPLIQCRRDRDTGQVFEILDGMMFKDGYLYKKVSIDSLSSGLIPSKDEVMKFDPPIDEDFTDVKWLSDLYNEQGEQIVVYNDKFGDETDELLSDGIENGFKIHDMVFFSQKGFGVIISIETTDNCCKVLTDGFEVPAIITVKLSELKKSSFHKKFTAKDHHEKTISMSDIVKIVKGPLEGRLGIVRQIFGGTVFLYDETAEEYGGYLCCKAQNCENVTLSGDVSKEKAGESPVSAKTTVQESINNQKLNRGDKDEVFTVGQSLRIRMGPLKGYLCKVLAVWQSDITVKLDSRQKILTVKAECLVEIGAKKAAIPKRSSTCASRFLPKPDQKSQKSMCKLQKKGFVTSSHKAIIATTTNSSSIANQKALTNTAQTGGWRNVGASINKAATTTGFARPNSCHGTPHSWGTNFGEAARSFVDKPMVTGFGVYTSPSFNKQDGGPSFNRQVQGYSRSIKDTNQCGNWERHKTFEGQHGLVRRSGRGGGRGGKNQFGRGRGGGGRGIGRDQFGRGRGESGGGTSQFGCGGTSQFARGRREGPGGTSQFAKGRGEGRGNNGGRGGNSPFGRGGGASHGGSSPFGKGRGEARGGNGGQGGSNQYGRGRGEEQGGTNHFGRGRGSGQGGNHNFGRGRSIVQGQSSGPGFGNWSKGRMNDDANQHCYLEKPKVFEGGRGLGGRTRGRGGNRGGRTQPNCVTNAGMSIANPTSNWGNFQGFDASKNEASFSGDQNKRPWWEYA